MFNIIVIILNVYRIGFDLYNITFYDYCFEGSIKLSVDGELNRVSIIRMLKFHIYGFYAKMSILDLVRCRLLFAKFTLHDWDFIYMD